MLLEQRVEVGVCFSKRECDTDRVAKFFDVLGESRRECTGFATDRVGGSHGGNPGEVVPIESWSVSHRVGLDRVV